jgi:F-box protein 21
MAPASTINDLPDEVLDQILYYLSPEQTILSIRRASKRFARLCEEPLLWRYHCRTEFTYWDAKHRIKQKFGGDVSDVEWKKLYIYRKNIDIRTSELLDSILSEQIGRIDKTKGISEFGYDAKDILLRNCQAETDTDDVLARRCVLNQQLLPIHRELEELTGQLDSTAVLSSIISTEQRRSTNGTD